MSWKIEARGEYPPDWKGIADRVKDAASWRCVRCDHPHDVETGYVLTVHHMNGDKADGRWWNLLALCQRCHLVIQAKVNPAQSYLHPHTGWFRIYAAGYYASAVLGLELSRAETELRIDELLHAGQPWLG